MRPGRKGTHGRALPESPSHHFWALGQTFLSAFGSGDEARSFAPSGADCFVVGFSAEPAANWETKGQRGTHPDFRRDSGVPRRYRSLAAP